MISNSTVRGLRNGGSKTYVVRFREHAPCTIEEGVGVNIVIRQAPGGSEFESRMALRQ
jgi:hypothetical protein